MGYSPLHYLSHDQFKPHSSTSVWATWQSGTSTVQNQCTFVMKRNMYYVTGSRWVTSIISGRHHCNLCQTSVKWIIPHCSKCPYTSHQPTNPNSFEHPQLRFLEHWFSSFLVRFRLLLLLLLLGPFLRKTAEALTTCTVVPFSKCWLTAL